MTDSYPMTREGYNRIRAELDHLENVEMPKVSQRVADARAEGDLKENAEYHGARESQGMLQAKINMLRHKLAHAIIMDGANINREEVAFGATVKVRDVEFDEEEEFTLVGAGDEDYDAGRINITSPLGQALLGHRVGDTIDFQAPKGVFQYEVLEIRYEE